MSSSKYARGTLINSPSVFAGKDASRALAQSSLKKEECRPEWEDLKPEHIKVLDDWFTFFSKRYNIKGKVATGNANLWLTDEIGWYSDIRKAIIITFLFQHIHFLRLIQYALQNDISQS